MENHTKVYFKFFGIIPGEFVECEMCGAKANDIHHIDSKGMGGTSENKDYIKNLAALCRKCHELCHASKVYNRSVLIVHNYKLLEYEER